MVRNRGGRGEGAANGQQAEEPELELDREKGGPRVRGRHRADHVPVFPRAGTAGGPSPLAQQPRPARTQVPGEPEDAQGSRAVRRPQGAGSS